jgi:VIT1/CCC1 family predicted Fe2+/Mn2+ transporter
MEERTVSNLLPETKSYGYSNDTANSLIVVFLVLLGVAAVLSLFLEAEVLLLLLGIVVVGLGLFLLIYLLSGLVNFMLGI